MRVAWSKFKQFWMAEEVPRWFGLSLVAVCLCGLGVVSYLGMEHARKESVSRLERTLEYAAQALADHLGAVDGHASAATVPVDAMARHLREFAANVPVRSARVVDGDGRIRASVVPREVGSIATDPIVGRPTAARIELFPTRLEASDQDVMVIRGPIRRPSLGAVAGRGDDEVLGTADRPPLYLEIILDEQLFATVGLGGHAGTLTIVLVVLGALLCLYRGLRGQFRGLVLIKGRLETHGERLEADLEALRISNCDDVIVHAWNELVDITQTLSEGSQVASANEELKTVLERAGGGALSEALNAIPDGVIYITDEVRFEYVNSTGCRLLGWKPSEARGKLLAEATASGVGEKILDALREALTPSGTYEPLSTLIEVQGSGELETSCYRVTVTPLHRAMHEGECVALIRDVSQQMRADKARDEFVAQVTHELRTPLTNIRAYAETLSSGMFDDPKVITECYNVIMKETRRLGRLIEDILSISQLEVGSIQLEKEQMDLGALLTESVRDVRGLADEKDIDIQIALPAKLEPIRADRDKLAVVVNNLLGNAIKYTPPGGNVVVGCQVSATGVVITVKDNGIGIEEDDRSRVFEKFQRGSSAEVQNEIGTGIGLYTAREIARRHGGDIELMSQQGEGSTFIVRLPHQGTRAGALTTSEEA